MTKALTDNFHLKVFERNTGEAEKCSRFYLYYNKM